MDDVKENTEYGIVQEMSWFIISEEAYVCL